MVSPAAEGPAAEGRFADFYLIGAPRCGTTSMYTCLKQHPEVYLSVLKEPHFFSTDLTSPPQAVVDEALYLTLFEGAKSEQRIGEGSVWYLESKDAPAGILERVPDARALVMLRHPIEMVFSLHGLYTRTGNEELTDFDEALEAQEDRARGERIPDASYFPEGLQYNQVALYSEKLERYFQAFGRDRVHVVLFEDFVKEPVQTFRDTLEFIGVDPTFEAEFDRAKGKEMIRGKVLNQLRTTDPIIRAKMRGGGTRHTVPRSKSIQPATRQRLIEHFTPDVRTLSGMIDRDLSSWLL